MVGLKGGPWQPMEPDLEIWEFCGNQAGGIRQKQAHAGGREIKEEPVETQTQPALVLHRP